MDDLQTVGGDGWMDGTVWRMDVSKRELSPSKHPQYPGLDA